MQKIGSEKNEDVQHSMIKYVGAVFLSQKTLLCILAIVFHVYKMHTKGARESDKIFWKNLEEGFRMFKTHQDT